MASFVSSRDKFYCVVINRFGPKNGRQPGCQLVADWLLTGPRLVANWLSSVSSKKKNQHAAYSYTCLGTYLRDLADLGKSDKQRHL